MASGGTILKNQRFKPPKGSPKFLLNALDDIGIREWRYVTDSRGRKRKEPNPVVREYSKTVINKPNFNGYHPRNVPWCAFWIGAKLAESGRPHTGNGMARSYLRWGQDVGTNIDDWKCGDIVIFWRGRVNDGVSGHVGIILKWSKRYIYVLGGNQGDAVSIRRFSRAKLLGVRRHRAWWKSKTLQSAGGSASAEGASQTIKELVPEPSIADNVATTAEAIKGPLEALAQFKPEIVFVLSAISIALALYAAYKRFGDHKSGKNV